MAWMPDTPCSDCGAQAGEFCSPECSWRQPPRPKRATKKPDTPCSSCGTPTYTGTGSLPADRRVCRPCRRSRKSETKGARPARACAICSASFAPARSTQRYCSADCRAQVPYVPRSYQGRTCEACGRKYDATHRAQRTCSRACGVKVNAGYDRPKPWLRKEKWPTSPVWFPNCLHCSRTFAARSGRSKICSDECQKARKAVYERHYNQTVRPTPPRLCDCGAPVTGHRRRCGACAELARRRRKERDKRRRRALKAGAATEPYALAEIAARDKNMCGLCRKRVAMTKKVPHPKAPTIDHVVPLSEGGDDTRANVQLAHFLCNSLKCAGGSQQLALVG